MKAARWLLLFVVVLAVASAVLVGPPLVRILQEPPPDPAAVAGTVVLDMPVPETSPLRAPEPVKLSGRLITVAPAVATVPQGVVHLPPGTRVAFVEERGERAVVRLGDQPMEVPRSALLPLDAPAEPARAAGLAGVLPVAMPRAVERLVYSPPTSLGIEVKEIGSGRGVDRRWQAWWGSYERDFYATKGLEVNVRNVSRRDSGECQASVLWLARPLGGGDLRVHHAEAIPLTVGSATTETRRFWCPLAASNETRLVLADQHSVAGHKLDGWLVVISRNGHTLAGRGSGPSQERLLRDPVQLQATLAAYQPTGRTASAEMPKWRSDAARTEWQNRYRSEPTKDGPVQR